MVSIAEARRAPAEDAPVAIESSLIQAVPTTIPAATLSPLMKRPTPSPSTEAGEQASTMLPRIPSTRPASSTGRRPKRSDQPPASAKPGTMPRTTVASRPTVMAIVEGIEGARATTSSPVASVKYMRTMRRT